MSWLNPDSSFKTQPIFMHFHIFHYSFSFLPSLTQLLVFSDSPVLDLAQEPIKSGSCSQRNIWEVIIKCSLITITIQDVLLVSSSNYQYIKHFLDKQTITIKTKNVCFIPSTINIIIILPLEEDKSAIRKKQKHIDRKGIITIQDIKKSNIE